MIYGLKRAYAIPCVVLNCFGFSTVSRNSKVFSCYRFVLLLSFIGCVLMRHRSVVDSQKQQSQALIFSIPSFNVWLVSITSLAFQLHQIIVKKEGLEAFHVFERIDKIFFTFYGTTFDYKRKLFVNIFSLFVLAACLTVSFSFEEPSSDLWVFIVSAFSSLIVAQFFFVLLLVINFCHEILIRLKCLNDIISRSNKNRQHENDNILLIAQLSSQNLRNIYGFFGAEILMILGKFHMKEL